MSDARRPVLERGAAMRLAATEYDRFAAQLDTLSADEWKLPTACEGWDVRAMAAHIAGMERMAASPLELRRQMNIARKSDGIFIDALTALQVGERADRTPAEILAELKEAGPKAAKGRRRVPRLLHRKTIPAAETDTVEPWSLGYLLEVILTRDPWMHRMDIAEATGREPVLTADHDGVLVDDVVKEWAGRHGQPCTVVLDGPAGGTWTFGTGGETVELDAVAFCRTIAGRVEPVGLLKTAVPF